MKLDAMGHRAAREFELMNYAWQDGAPVPKPYERIEHVFSMEYLGTPAEAAPILQHAFLADPERFLRETLRGIERLAEAGVVHSDLSPFNILVHRDQPWIIDLAACYRVDRLGESPWVRLTEAQTAIEHGLEAIARYFRRYAIFFDSVEVLNRITRGLDRFGVLG
jgi:RIO kinase 1